MEENQIKLGLAYGDVLIVPGYSRVVTRKLINLRTKFSKNIWLNIPIVSANMDTVTEGAMAIAMAREGGVGVIHRFMPIDQQVAEVRRVKRAETLIVVDPVVVSKEMTLKEALVIMRNNGVSAVLVVDKEGVLEGIVTARDIRFRSDMDAVVCDIMTPRLKLITANPNIKKEEVIKIFNRCKIEKLPLVDQRGVLKGLITAADFSKTNRYRKAAKDRRGRLLVGAAIGVKDGEERSDALVKAGVDALVIDIAHGHHASVIKLTTLLKEKYRDEVDVVAGNVATARGTEDLIKAGADAVKVGIGPGKVCSTRIIAGAGVPQFTAVLECSKIANRYNVPIIADGGIQNSGDLAKAIGAGGSTAMIGGLLASTKESPGDYFIEDSVAFKAYRGLASHDASIDRANFEKNLDRQQRVAEGIATKIPYRGDVAVVVRALIDGLQSGMSYSGAENILEFWKEVKFIRVTGAGIHESKPRY